MSDRGEPETPQESLERLQGAAPPRPPFPTRRVGGYVIDEVDTFFDAIERRTPEEVRSVQFASVQWRKGYDMEVVDQALDTWEAELRRRSTPPAPPTPS